MSTFRMPFGKYKGTLIDEVPADYLCWLLDQGVCSNQQVQEYLEEHEEDIRLEAEQDKIFIKRYD